MPYEKAKVTSYVLYGLSAAVFAGQCIWSVMGISPFERLGMFVLTAVLLHIASAIRICNSDAQTQQRIMKRTYCLMFGLYLLLFLTFVFLDGYFDDDIRSAAEHKGGSLRDYIENSASFVPFESTRGLLYGYKMNWITPEKPFVNIVGNLLLCLPYAFFLPLFFRKQHNFFVFFLTVSGISCMVEATQLLTRRGICDIDDLIYNVVGACVVFGFLHIKPVRKLLKKITKLQY